jgi:hypothetical protein
MKGKELKALITLAGKVDPSLQAAMLKASNQSKKTSGAFGKAFSSINKTVLSTAGKISPAFQSGLQKVESGASKAFSVVKKGAGAVGKGFAVVGKAAAGIAVGIGAFGIASLTAMAPLASQGLEYASSLTEVQNVVDTTFGKGASVIDSFSKTALQSYGLSTLQAKQYSSVLGSMYKSMGLGSQQTLTMSQNMTALAGDMASFYNLNPDEAFQKIQSGVSGETEPLKELGINMSEANLQAFAMSQGIKTNYQDMTQAQQATLRYNYLLNATKDAQGDFAKTSGSFANQQRLLKSNFQQMAGTVMSKVMPALSQGMQTVNKFITGLDTGGISNVIGTLANSAVSFLPAIQQMMPMIGKTFSSVLPALMQIAPLVGNLISLILPAVAQIAPEFGNMLQMILPALINIAQQLMPIMILGVQTFMSVLQPILPPLLQVAQQILPPVLQILTAIAPILVVLANIFSKILGPVLTMVVGLIQNIADLISSVAKPVGDFFNSIGSFLGISGSAQQKIASVGNTAATSKVPAYANGGFADEPSIFGEAGLEAAIPIRPGNSRSLGLLARTARLLGVSRPKPENPGGDLFKIFKPKPKPENPGGGGRPILFTYAPVFNGERPTESVLKRDAQNVKRIIEDYFGEKGRLTWD